MMRYSPIFRAPPSRPADPPCAVHRHDLPPCTDPTEGTPLRCRFGPRPRPRGTPKPPFHPISTLAPFGNEILVRGRRHARPAAATRYLPLPPTRGDWCLNGDGTPSRAARLLARRGHRNRDDVAERPDVARFPRRLRRQRPRRLIVIVRVVLYQLSLPPLEQSWAGALLGRGYPPWAQSVALVSARSSSCRHQASGGNRGGPGATGLGSQRRTGPGREGVEEFRSEIPLLSKPASQPVTRRTTAPSSPRRLARRKLRA